MSTIIYFYNFYNLFLRSCEKFVNFYIKYFPFKKFTKFLYFYKWMTWLSINIFFDSRKLLGNKRYKLKDIRKYPRNKDRCWGRNKRTSILGPLFRRQRGTRRLLSTPCFRRNFLAAQIRASFPLRDIARQTALTLLARRSRIKLHRFVTGQKNAGTFRLRERASRFLIRIS